MSLSPVPPCSDRSDDARLKGYASEQVNDGSGYPDSSVFWFFLTVPVKLHYPGML